MHGGSVLDWVLQNLQAVGYATAWTIGSPWMLGLPFNRPRLFIACLRLDLARASWWARMSPDHWFRLKPGHSYTTVRSCLEAFDTPQDILEQRGARWNKPFVRCSWQTVPHHDPAVVPRTYVVDTYGPKVPRFKEQNNNRVFSIDGLMPTMTRQGPHPLGMIFIPGSAPGARRYRAAVIRSYTCDEVRRGVGLEGWKVPG
jgi:hypothetical protein